MYIYQYEVKIMEDNKKFLIDEIKKWKDDKEKKNLYDNINSPVDYKPVKRYISNLVSMDYESHEFENLFSDIKNAILNHN